jgi:hypothetical protein
MADFLLAVGTLFVLAGASLSVCSIEFWLAGGGHIGRLWWAGPVSFAVLTVLVLAYDVRRDLVLGGRVRWRRRELSLLLERAYRCGDRILAYLCFYLMVVVVGGAGLGIFGSIICVGGLLGSLPWWLMHAQSGVKGYEFALGIMLVPLLIKWRALVSGGRADQATKCFTTFRPPLDQPQTSCDSLIGLMSDYSGRSAVVWVDKRSLSEQRRVDTQVLRVANWALHGTGSRILAATSKPRAFFEIDLATGEKKDIHPVGSCPISITECGDLVYVDDDRARCWARCKAADGAELGIRLVDIRLREDQAAALEVRDDAWNGDFLVDSGQLLSLAHNRGSWMALFFLRQRQFHMYAYHLSSRVLTLLDSAARMTGPALSENGVLVYGRSEGDQDSLVMRRLDQGGDATVLCRGRFYLPRISPDGLWVAATCYRGDRRLHIVELGGEHPRVRQFGDAEWAGGVIDGISNDGTIFSRHQVHASNFASRPLTSEN